jgi:hypothetical protein
MSNEEETIILSVGILPVAGGRQVTLYSAPHPSGARVVMARHVIVDGPEGTTTQHNYSGIFTGANNTVLKATLHFMWDAEHPAMTVARQTVTADATAVEDPEE